MSDKLYLTWDEIARDTKILIDQLTVREKPFQGILAVTRGGLVPAGIISQHLDIKNIATIGLESYRDGEQGKIKVIKKPNKVPESGEGWLIIDELVDTGATAEYLKNLFPEAPLAVLYTKPEGRAYPDFVAKNFDEDRWIVFPWESDV